MKVLLTILFVLCLGISSGYAENLSVSDKLFLLTRTLERNSIHQKIKENEELDKFLNEYAALFIKERLLRKTIKSYEGNAGKRGNIINRYQKKLEQLYKEINQRGIFNVSTADLEEEVKETLNLIEFAEDDMYFEKDEYKSCKDELRAIQGELKIDQNRYENLLQDNKIKVSKKDLDNYLNILIQMKEII